MIKKAFRSILNFSTFFIFGTVTISIIFFDQPVRSQQIQNRSFGALDRIMEMPSDSNKVKAYFIYADTCRSLWASQPLKIVSTAAEIKNLCNKLVDQKHLLAYFFLMNNFYAYKGDYGKAYENITLALDLSKKLGQKMDMVKALGRLANYYIILKQYDKALLSYQKIAQIFKETDDQSQLALAYNRIAMVYSNQEKNYEAALKYDDKALSAASLTADDELKANCYTQLAWDHFNLKHYEITHDYLDRFFRSPGAAQSYYYFFGTFVLANLYRDAPPELLKRMGISSNQRYQRAADLFTKTLNIALKNNLLEDIPYDLKALSDVHLKQGKVVQAFREYQQYIIYRDSINNERGQKDILQKQLNVEFNKQADSLKFREQLSSTKLHAKQVQSYYITAAAVISLILSFFVYKNYRKANLQTQRSNDLLLNILPADVAEELKDKGSAEARSFNNVTVLFTDFVNFTKVSEMLSPQALVNELNECFTAFDEIMLKYGIEKIKTIGDAYLAVAGIPNADAHHARNAVNAASEILQFMKKRKISMLDQTFDIRLGIHSGSVVAGIVGARKFAYDVWGDTVNIAARMEQNSEPGKINISESTYILVKDNFNFTYRGEIPAKNKGMLKMYFLDTGIIDD